MFWLKISLGARGFPRIVKFNAFISTDQQKKVNHENKYY